MQGWLPHLQVAFDRRKPDEVRAMRINDVRALMEL